MLLRRRRVDQNVQQALSALYCRRSRLRACCPLCLNGMTLSRVSIKINDYGQVAYMNLYLPATSRGQVWNRPSTFSG